MSETPSRMFGLVCVLIAVWVGVYWFYTPRSQVAAAIPPAEPAAPMITLDPREPTPIPPPADPQPFAPPPPTATTKQVVTPAEPAKPSGPKVVPPAFRTYVVQEGDVSFEAIARRLFNDRRKWEVIARANPFVTPDRMKPGRTELLIPLDPDNIQGKVVTESGAAVPAASPTVQETSYVIQSGDTLWEISRKVYKRGSAWRTIYDANRDVIRNPDRPVPGTVLKIPRAPAD